MLPDGKYLAEVDSVNGSRVVGVRGGVGYTLTAGAVNWNVVVSFFSCT